MSWSDDAARNRELWTKSNAEHTGPNACAHWAAEEISWGIFGIPESEVRALPDVEGREVVELGCGTAYVSAWLARRGARPVGVDWWDGVEFHLSHGDWIRLLRANGFEVLDLIELQAPESAVSAEYYDYVTADWARKWPAEEIWKARKR